MQVVRGEISRIKRENFAKAAEAVGYSNPGVGVKSTVLHAIYTILMIPFLDIGPIVLTAATISFLGLGAPLGYADWGQMLAYRIYTYCPHYPYYSLSYWYTFVIPGLFLFTFVLGWILLGDAFRDLLDHIKR